MDDVATDPWTLVKLLYLFAAMFALGAGYFWFRFASVQEDRQSKGGPITIRWLKEAGIATGLAFFCAAGAHIVSITI